MSWLDDLKGIVSDIGGVVKEGVNVYGSVKGQIEGVDKETSKSVTQPAAGTYDPKLKISDFGFTPNWYLLGFGAAVLIIALVLSRR